MKLGIPSKALNHFQRWFRQGADSEEHYDLFDNVELARAAFRLGWELAMKEAQANAQALAYKSRRMQPPAEGN